MLIMTVHAIPHVKVAVNASYQCQIKFMSIVLLSSFNILLAMSACLEL